MVQAMQYFQPKIPRASEVTILAGTEESGESGDGR
jgi:hypothetical protein